jgi:hypothetical protein
MDLKQFVSQSVEEILDAITSLKTDPRVAPQISRPGGGDPLRTSTGRVVFPVEFDVAVTVSDKSQIGGGGGIAVIGLGSLKGEAGTTALREAVSRVKFTVPLDLSMPNSERLGLSITLGLNE